MVTPCTYVQVQHQMEDDMRGDEGGIRRRVVRNPSHMENNTKCIFSHTLDFNQAKYNVVGCRSI